MLPKNSESISEKGNIFTIKKNIFLNLLFALLLFGSIAQGQSKAFYLRARIDSLLQDNYFEKTLLACKILNLENDSVLYSKNERMLLHPASNMKIVTTSTALYFLGPDYNFTTTLYYDGKIEGDVLKGNIYLKGGLDPDFTSDDLEYFAKAIESLDINAIEGNIYADVSALDSLFWGNGWMWDDDPYSDFPYMTALNINDDCVQIIVSPGKLNDKANVEILPHSLFYTFENNAITTSAKTDLNVMRDWINRHNHFIISGTVNIDDKPDTTVLNLVNTDLYAPTLLKEMLYRDGINCFGIVDTGKVPTGANKIFELKRPFKNVIVNLNKTSDNLSAEMTLRALGLKYFGKPTSAKKGIKMVDSLITIIGLDPSYYRIVDGSGVSHYNLINPELIVGILKYFYHNKPELYRILKDSFPVAGVDGTLKHRMKKGLAFQNVHAKTGTLSGVSTLSGYAKTKGGNDIAFSIFIQNFVGSADSARSYQNKICEIISEMK